jgi:hypothetical protein
MLQTAQPASAWLSCERRISGFMLHALGTLVGIQSTDNLHFYLGLGLVKK